MPRKIRVLVGKPGLDGHDRGAKVVAAALRDAGMEVIYTGLHQSAEQIVEAALQEDVDVVALSILSGAHMTLFPEVQRLMHQRGIGDKLLTGGGIIPPEDVDTLHRSGVGRLFGPGASTQDIAEYIRAWFTERYGAAATAPPARAYDDEESAGAASQASSFRKRMARAVIRTDGPTARRDENAPAPARRQKNRRGAAWGKPARSAAGRAKPAAKRASERGKAAPKGKPAPRTRRGAARSRGR